MFVDQQFAASDGQKGDCVRACLASILDRPITAVPHFALLDLADGIHVAMEALVGWLMYHGYETDIAPSPASLPLHIINGISPRGIPHAVVGDTASSAVVHDPHPSRAGLSMISGRIYLSRAEASRDEHIAAVERAARAAAQSEIETLRRERDEATRHFDAAWGAAVQANTKRDAAMALLRECREFIESAPMARDATRRKFPLCARIDALLGDGGEAGR